MSSRLMRIAPWMGLVILLILAGFVMYDDVGEIVDLFRVKIEVIEAS